MNFGTRLRCTRRTDVGDGVGDGGRRRDGRVGEKERETKGRERERHRGHRGFSVACCPSYPSSAVATAVLHREYINFRRFPHADLSLLISDHPLCPHPPPPLSSCSLRPPRLPARTTSRQPTFHPVHRFVASNCNSYRR